MSLIKIIILINGSRNKQINIKFNFNYKKIKMAYGFKGYMPFFPFMEIIMDNKFSGRKKKKRKPVPQPPKYYWWQNDNCWWCQNRSGCRGCKVLKGAVAANSKKKRSDINEY